VRNLRPPQSGSLEGAQACRNRRSDHRGAERWHGTHLYGNGHPDP